MRGHTLAELVAVLILVAIGAALLAPTTRRHRDRAAVLAAREAVGGLLSEARVAAVASGRAEVILASRPARAWVGVGDSIGRSVAIESDLGVSVELLNGADSAWVQYGPLGLGRFASETFVFSRGGSSARLVVSAYGRVRRQ